LALKRCALLLGEGQSFLRPNPDRLASAHATLQNEYPDGDFLLPLRR
jgi:hypothetical protein